MYIYIYVYKYIYIKCSTHIPSYRCRQHAYLLTHINHVLYKGTCMFLREIDNENNENEDLGRYL